MPLSRADIEAMARGHGFNEVRFAQAEEAAHAHIFEAWLADGHHADMDWLAERTPLRRDPRERTPTARTVMALAMHHEHAVPPDPGGRTGRVARYAWGRDYHNLMGKRLRKLTRDLRAAGITCWGGVDTAPLLERSWATTAGLGFNGKNGVQILPARTSWMMLGAVVMDVAVPPDAPIARDHCGACVRCHVACPTDAFVAPHLLDARRCIAYWTIEAQRLAPRDLRPSFGRWVFGCDVCQAVCPHNAAVDEAVHDAFAPRNAWLDLDDIVFADDDTLMARFIGTPLRRPKAHGLKRNALYALGNLGDRDALDAIDHALTHPHHEVQGAAMWARARLDALPDAPPNGLSATGIEEWEAAARGEVAVVPAPGRPTEVTSPPPPGSAP